MTAILAVATTGFAFVAGDTKRTGALHATTKVHRWGEAVVFAQAGNGPSLSRLIGKMMAERFAFGDNLRGFECAFNSLHLHYFKQACWALRKAGKSIASADGTLLVADADTGAVFEFEFATGVRQSFPGSPYRTGGTRNLVPAAASQWAIHSPRALDLWATASIDLCKGSDVDWPIDVVVVRPNDSGGMLTVQRRYRSAIVGPGDPNFRI